MAQVTVFGRVTADFEMQTSQSKNPYVRFDLAETIGYGKNARPQFLQIWARGRNAENLIRGKVKKGSLIRVSGSLELEEFTKRDGVTKDKRLKIWLESWGFVIPERPGRNKSDDDNQQNHEPKSSPDAPETLGVIDGEREPLPE